MLKILVSIFSSGKFWFYLGTTLAVGREILDSWNEINKRRIFIPHFNHYLISNGFIFNITSNCNLSIKCGFTNRFYPFITEEFELVDRGRDMKFSKNVDDLIDLIFNQKCEMDLFHNKKKINFKNWKDIPLVFRYEALLYFDSVYQKVVQKNENKILKLYFSKSKYINEGHIFIKFEDEGGMIQLEERSNETDLFLYILEGSYDGKNFNLRFKNYIQGVDEGEWNVSLDQLRLEFIFPNILLLCNAREYDDKSFIRKEDFPNDLFNLLRINILEELKIKLKE